MKLQELHELLIKASKNTENFFSIGINEKGNAIEFCVPKLFFGTSKELQSKIDQLVRHLNQTYLTEDTNICITGKVFTIQTLLHLDYDKIEFKILNF